MPGISHPESGGLSVRQLIDAIHAIPGKGITITTRSFLFLFYYFSFSFNFLLGRIIGADIVEYNPTYDIRDLTGFVASKLLKEVSSKIIETNQN